MDSKSKESFQKGKELYNQENYQEAIPAFEEAEKQNTEGKYPLAAYHIGLSYYSLSKFQEAIDSFTKAEQDSENGIYPQATCKKGCILMELGKFINAIHAFAKAEKDQKDGKYPEASFYKGKCYSYMGILNEAIDAFTKAEQDSVKWKYPQASYEKGVLFKQQEKYMEALESFVKCQMDSPEGNFADATEQKELLLSKLSATANIEEISDEKKLLNEIESAEKAETAPLLKEENAVDTFYKGFYLFSDGKYEKALDLFETIDQYKEVAPVIEDCTLINKSIVLTLLGNHNEAFEIIQNLKPFPYDEEDPVINFLVSYLLIQHKLYAEAEKYAYKAIEGTQTKTFPWAHYTLGLSRRFLNKHQLALENFNEAINNTPDKIFPFAYFDKGILHRSCGQIEEATEAFELAIEQTKDHFHPEAYYELAKIYEAKDTKKSQEYIAQALHQEDKYYKALQVARSLAYNYNKDSEQIYRNRQRFIEERLFLTEENCYHKDIVERSKRCPHTNDFLNCLLLTSNLLTSKEFPFENLDLDYEQRLRYAYLIFFCNQYYHESYAIIKSYSLEQEIDIVFLLICTYLIGEPVASLKEHLDQYGSYNLSGKEVAKSLIDHLNTNIEEKVMADNYLLNFPENERLSFIESISQQDYPMCISEILRDIIDKQRLSYEMLPISTQDLHKSLDEYYLKMSL